MKNFLPVVLILVALLACQTSAVPPAPTATMPVPVITLAPAATLPPASLVPEANPLGLPAGFLADPNIACVIDLYRGVSCLDGDGWHIYADTDFTQHPSLPVTMIQCPGGRTYFSDENAVYLLDGAAPVKLGNEELSANLLACAPGQGLWAAYLDEISFFDGSTWTHYPAADTLWTGDPNGLVESLVTAPNGHLVVLGGNTVSTFDGSSWKNITPGSGSYNRLAVDAGGNVWLAAYGALLMYDGSNWSSYPDPPSMPSVRMLGLDPHGRVWIGDQDAVFNIFDPQTKTWQPASNPQDNAKRIIRDMQFDGQGRLWVSTEYGLDVYDGSSWVSYRMDTAGLFSNNADRVVVLGNGPSLPVPQEKSPGSVSGRLVNLNSAPFTDAQVELCLSSVTGMMTGVTPCAGQPYHTLAAVNPDGSFLFSGIPVGRYHLMIRIGSAWANMIDTTASSTGSEQSPEFTIQPGLETRLGDIQTH